MDFDDDDDDMSGLQIEDLGAYFLQTDINDSWKGFTLGYTDDGQEQGQDTYDIERFSSCATTSIGDTKITVEQLTSPSLSLTSEILKHDTELDMEPSFSLSHTDYTSLFQTELSPVSSKPEVTSMHQTTNDAIELGTFRLNNPQLQEDRQVMSNLVGSTKDLSSLGSSFQSATPQVASLQCQHVISSDNDDQRSTLEGGSDSFKRICSTIASNSSINVNSPTPEDERCCRKKSREKMRRQEVNIKFEELVDLLGLSNRVRKSAILREAVSTIKLLKRERDELRRDRDRLQQDVRKLSTCLQYSHLGSMAAVNAAALLQQPSQQLPHRNLLAQQHAVVSNGLEAVHTHPLSIPHNPGTNCFPLASAYTTSSSQYLESQLSPASSSSVSGQVAIAPKSLKSAPLYSHHPHHLDE